MWESHESIYCLIPEIVVQPPKTPPIRSQVGFHVVSPWKSRAGFARTGIHDQRAYLLKKILEVPKDEKVYKFMLKLEEEARQRPRATFGHVPGSLNPSPDNWLRKHSKDPKIAYGVDRCSAHQKYKALVPLGPPTHGLNSGKNWIEENGRTAIKSKPPEVPPPPPPMVKKKNNGITPKYLLRRIRSALQKMEEARSPAGEVAGKCKHPDCRKLDEDERQDLIHALKLKWEKLNRAYQGYPSTIDTDSMKFRRERMEENLAQIERDVQLLSRRVVLISERPASTSPTTRRKEQRHLVSRAIG